MIKFFVFFVVIHTRIAYIESVTKPLNAKLQHSTTPSDVDHVTPKLDGKRSNKVFALKYDPTDSNANVALSVIESREGSLQSKEDVIASKEDISVSEDDVRSKNDVTVSKSDGINSRADFTSKVARSLFKGAFAGSTVGLKDNVSNSKEDVIGWTEDLDKSKEDIKASTVDHKPSKMTFTTTKVHDIVSISHDIAPKVKEIEPKPDVIASKVDKIVSRADIVASKVFSDVHNKIKDEPVEPIRKTAVNEGFSMAKFVSTSFLPSTFSYPITPLDQESTTKTAQIIKLISKSDAKQIIRSGPQKAYTFLGLRDIRNELELRRSKGRSSRRLNVKDGPLVFLLQPNLKQDQANELQSYISNWDNFKKRRQTESSESSSSSSSERGGLFWRQTNNDRGLGAHSAPGEKRVFAISNPEVVRQFVRRSNRRKHHQSTSSSSSSEDSDLRSSDARMSYPALSAIQRRMLDSNNPHVQIFDLRRRNKRRKKKKKRQHKKIRSRRHKKENKRKKELSTSSSSGDDDGDNDFRRMVDPGSAEYGEPAKHRDYNDEHKEANDKINYDERSDDYIITTKKGVWDYEHENWALNTRKVNWDDIRSSSEKTSNHNEYGRKKPSEDEDRRESLKRIDEEHRKLSLEKHKGYGGPIEPAVEAKVRELDLENNRHEKKKTFKKRIRQDSDENGGKYNNGKNGDRGTKYDSKRYKSKEYDRNRNGNNDAFEYRPTERIDDGDTYAEKNRYENEESYRQKKPRRPSDDAIPDKYYKEDKNYQSEREVKATKGKADRIVDEWMSKNNQKYIDDDEKDRNDYSKKKIGKYGPERSTEEHLEIRPTKQHFSGERHKIGRQQDDKSMWNPHRETNTASREKRPNYASNERGHPVKSPNEDIEFDDRDDGKKENPKVKLSILRQKEALNHIANSRDLRWDSHDAEDERPHKGQYKKDNEQAQQDVQAHKPIQQPNKKRGVVEDFWNRHAHNEWDKVGVVHAKKAPLKQFPVVEKPIKGPKIAKEEKTWDRHGNNDWDKVGNHDGGPAQLTYDTQPQSHRSQDQGTPLYFGYVHTPLPFKGKQTIFED